MSSLQTDSFVWRIPSLTSSQKLLLCHGYIRVQNCLKIPFDIKELCTKYFCPNDETTVNELKHAVNGVSFCSPVFTMFSAEWYLEVHPNGYRSTETNEVKLWLCSKVLSPNLESIKLGIKLIFVEGNVVYECSKAFGAQQEKGWPTGTMQTSVLLQYDTLSFKVIAQLLHRKMTISYAVGIIQDRFNSISSQISKLSSDMKSNTDKIDELVNSMSQVCVKDVTSEQNKLKDWLTNTAQLPQYYALFVDNGVERLSVVQLLDMDSLTKIGVDKIGHRLQILHQIKQLQIT